LRSYLMLHRSIAAAGPIMQFFRKDQTPKYAANRPSLAL
jgi:hypothetical protein